MTARQLLHPMRPLTKAFVIAGMLAMWIAPSAWAVTMDWVQVGNPGNAPDPASGNPGTPTGSNCYSANCGSVTNVYYISKYDTTNAQYAEFLNAKAASDPLDLYSAGNRGSDPNNGGITRSGSSGSYSYAANAGFENAPVTFVTLYDALRFSNWLNNGQGTGDTETGAYTITAAGITNNTITRNAGAIAFLTNENEWYKAAYYNPITNSYFAYPAGSSTPTTCAAPGATPNTANCNLVVGHVTNVGAYTGSASPYGTFDQGGNVWQWIDGMSVGPFSQGIRGGSFKERVVYGAASPTFDDPTLGLNNEGFRVASLVPEPGTGLLVMTGLLGLAARRRRA